MPAMLVDHEVDPKEDILQKVGEVRDLEPFNSQVLVAVYQRGGTGDVKEITTKGGIIVPVTNLEEDQYQSKVGLILKMGPNAFRDEKGEWFVNANINVGDWVVYRPSDGWRLDLIGDPPRIAGKTNKIQCRMMEDISIRARISHPDAVW